MDCNSDHVVYLLPCATYEMQYAGSTITKCRTRFTDNHKSRLNARGRLTTENKAKDECMYLHFNQPDH